MDKKNLEQHESYTPKKEDFVLVQKDQKIYDVKMETKATTFVKDAFKRFCKNKSSVVGAFIIGFIMLLAIIVPFVSPYNVDVPEPAQALLPPKAFNAGTGWWDGTKEYKNVPYNTITDVIGSVDPDTKIPTFNQNAILNKDKLKIRTGELVNINNADQTSYNGTTIGGSLMLTGAALKDGQDPYVNSKRLDQYNVFKLTADGGFVLNVDMRDLEKITTNKVDTYNTEYRIFLVKGPENGSKTNVLNLTEAMATEAGNQNGWISVYKPFTIDLSAAIAGLGITEIENAAIKVEIAGKVGKNTHLLVNRLEVTSNKATPEEKEYLEKISIVNPSETFFLRKNNAGKFPTGAYRTTATMSVYEAGIALVDFVYDEYAAKLGLISNFHFGKSDMDLYIANKWCEYDYNVGPSSFKVLDPEKCPVSSVATQYNGEGDFSHIINLTGDVTWYKYKGLDSMPRFLLGANANGYDLIKLSFVALRTSLLIAIVSSAICLAIGLCWGSVSGYFGGNIDLTMERITDILANIPFIVVMTLTILVLGNNIFTFCLALCLTSWIGVAARTRTQFYRFKGREYILASRTLGASDSRLIFKHILPNALGTIVTSSVLMIPGVIFSEASISYLGLGLQGQKSFGVILSENQQYISSLPALIVFPAVIISLLMISFNLFGNGLRDALNPSLKGSE